MTALHKKGDGTGFRAETSEGAIEATNRDGATRRIDALAPSSHHRTWLTITAAAVMVLAITAVATPFITQAVARAESRPEAFAMLLMSPEFLRR